MRIVMVSDVYFPRVNGVSTAIQTYRQTLRARGVEVALVAPEYGNDHREDGVRRVAGRPVPGDPEDRLVGWRAMHRAVENAVAEGCDLIHVQTPFVAHYAGCSVGKRLGLPVIATYHTLFEEYLKHYAPVVPAGWLRALARHFSKRQCNALDAIIVPSKAIHGRLTDYGVATPMHILPTGIPLPKVAANRRADFRARHGIDAQRPVALFVGRVAHEKNIDFLLDVLARTRRQIPNILLVIAGEGPALSHLHRAVASHGLGDCVRFIGYMDRRTELPACYAAADVFVFASRTETQGLVLLEAMAAGLPVVALAEMGTVDILGAGRGALVPEDNVESFSTALTTLMLDPMLRGRLSLEAREYAAEWSDEVLAERMADLYRKIVVAHKRNRALDFNLLPL